MTDKIKEQFEILEELVSSSARTERINQAGWMSHTDFLVSEIELVINQVVKIMRVMAIEGFGPGDPQPTVGEP